MRIKARILTFLFVISAISIGQDRYESLPHWIDDSPGYLWDGIQNTFSKPTPLIILGASAAGAYTVLQIDGRVLNYFKDQRLLPEKLSRFADLYGGTILPILLIPGIWLDSELKQETAYERNRKLEYASLAVGMDVVLTYGIKALTNRERPNQRNRYSFPSGHTSVSFAVAGILHELYGTQAGIISFTLATIVAISRVQDQEHFLSDVIFGAGLGLSVANGFTRVYKDSENKAGMPGKQSAHISFTVYF